MPYTSAAAAVDRLSEPTRPWRGSLTNSSQAAATRGRRPRPSEPMHQHDPPPVVRPLVGQIGIGGRAVHPGLALLRGRQPVREIAHARHREVLDRARRRLANRRRDLGGAPLGHHDSAAPGELGHAAYGAEVVRILDLVESDHERVVGLEQGIRVGVADRPRPRRRCPGGRARPRAPPPRARPRSAPRPRRARPRARLALWRTRAARGAGRAVPPGPGCARRRSRAAGGHDSGTSFAPSGVSRISHP